MKYSKRTRMAVATVALAGALAVAPFYMAKAQIKPDTLAAMPRIEAAAPVRKTSDMVRPYPVLSGFSLLPNPAARFRFGTFVYPFVAIAPKSEPAWGLQANIVSGSTGVTATAAGNGVTAALLQKIGPVVVAVELSNGTGKPAFAAVYTIKHDSVMLVSAALMRDLGNGTWTLGGEGRFALGNGWDITPSFKLSISDARQAGGGIGLQIAHNGIRASMGSDGRAFRLDVQKVFAIDIGNRTLLLLPDAFISIGKNGPNELDVGVTIVP